MKKIKITCDECGQELGYIIVPDNHKNTISEFLCSKHGFNAMVKGG